MRLDALLRERGVPGHTVKAGRPSVHQQPYRPDEEAFDRGVRNAVVPGQELNDEPAHEKSIQCSRVHRGVDRRGRTVPSSPRPHQRKSEREIQKGELLAARVPADLKVGDNIVYKQVGDTKLELMLFRRWKSGSRRRRWWFIFTAAAGATATGTG